MSDPQYVHHPDYDQRNRMPYFDEVNKKIGIPDEKVIILKCPCESAEYYCMEWHEDWPNPNTFMNLTTGYNVMMRKNQRETVWMVDKEMTAKWKQIREDAKKEYSEVEKLKEQLKKAKQREKYLAKAYQAELKKKEDAEIMTPKNDQKGTASGSGEMSDEEMDQWIISQTKDFQEKEEKEEGDKIKVPEMPKRTPPK